jgi:type II restriction enzyme
MNTQLVRELIERWREDEGGTYRRWFLWDERLKNFRAIRRSTSAANGMRLLRPTRPASRPGARTSRGCARRRPRSRRRSLANGTTTGREVQGWLRDLGTALGYDVWVASNDRNRACGAGRLGDGCLEVLPEALSRIETIPLIDVLWLERGGGRVAAAFEVEHTTSIHSGIICMVDLALGGGAEVGGLFLVAPDDREEDVRRQLARPAMRAVSGLRVKYLPYGELERNREAVARFGHGLKPIEALARSVA